MVQEATAKANAMVDNAQTESNAIRTAAVQYTDDSLKMIQDILVETEEWKNLPEYEFLYD